MRQRLAILLTFTMILSFFNGMRIQAAEIPLEDGFNYHLVTNEGLDQGVNGIDVKPQLHEGEAGVKWNMNNIGTYTLSYHVEQGSVTNKVILKFERDANSKVSLEAGLSTTPSNYSYRQFNGANNWSWITTSSAMAFKYDKLQFDVPGAPALLQQKQLEFNLGALLPVKLLLNSNTGGDTIHVSTRGVAAGNITEFKLEYDGGGGSDIQIKTLKTLKGLKNFKISPTHLTSGGNLTSKTVLGSQEEQPGSRPGVKIEFDKPKVLQGNQFVTTTDGTIQASLDLWIAASIDGSRREGADNSRTLQFSLAEDAPIINPSNNNPIGMTQTSGATISIYVSRDTDDLGIYSSRVVKWDKLDSSMLIGGGLSLNGGSMLGLPTGQANFTPENNGHTYLEYKLIRATESQVGIEIKPYSVNGAVTYSVKQGSFPNEGSLTSLLDHYYNRQNSDDTIYIVVPNLGEEKYYQIEANIGGRAPLKSQILRFQINNITAPPSVPRIERINNIYAVPSDVLGEEPQAVGFDIEWQAPPKDELTALLNNNGAIYYELSLHKTKKVDGTSRPPADSAVLKIFKVARTGGVITVTTETGTSGQGRYIEGTNTFVVGGVVLKDIDEPYWEQIDVGADRFNGAFEDYPLANQTTMAAYQIPKVYYATIRAINDPGDPTKKIAASQDSNDFSVPFDNVTEIIPTPTKLESINRSDITTTPQTIRYDVEIEKVNITNYFNKMLKPARLYLDNTTTAASYKGVYEIFLYQKNDTKATYTDQDFETALTTSGAAINVTPSALSLDTHQLDRLRDGEIIPIIYQAPSLGDGAGSDPITVTLENLDPNQVYYVKTRVRLEIYKFDKMTSTFGDKKERRSIFSKILSFTTISKPQPPAPEDKVPPAPEDFWLESQPNNTTAVLRWAAAEFEKDEDTTKIYYELARSTEVRLTEAEQSSKLNLEKLTEDNKNVTGFNTSGANLMTIGDSGAVSGWHELTPTQSSDSLRLEDNKLSPNTIYYYYVRTVCIIKGTVVRSEWIMLPVTTQPVERPIKLQVETPSKYAYNPKTETVISFLAPIPAGAAIPGEYEFEIAVQGESDSDYRLDYSKTALTSLEDPALITAGYRHFVYKIYNLKPGRRYDIKVRIVDKTNSRPENGEYPRSLYSDKVVARTEFDQDDQDQDNKFAEYLKRYDDEVEKLRRRPYWELTGENRFSGAFKYRQSYVNTELAIKNLYELQTGEDLNRLTYYLPANMLDKASDLNVIIQAVLGSQSMSLRPYTLTTDNEAIKEVVTQLNKKSIKGYYIKLDFMTLALSSKINGEDPLSPEIIVDIEIVSSDEEDMIIEDNIMIALNQLIARERLRVITRLESELSRGTIDEAKLTDIIASAVADIKQDHQKDVRSILIRRTNKTIAVDEIEKPILLTSVLDSYSVNGYYLQGSWSSVDVLQANGGYTIEAFKLGSYVFTGKKSLADTIPSLGMHQNMISKYNLADFFVLEPYMIKTGATKRQVYGAVARILGAQRNTDYMEYLRNRGLKGITSIGADKVIRQDEIIYIMMQAYEKIYNKPIATIQIKNRQSVSNIGAFQTQYRAYVYGGVELNIIPLVNRQVLPSKLMSVEETLQMLSKVLPK